MCTKMYLSPTFLYTPYIFVHMAVGVVAPVFALGAVAPGLPRSELGAGAPGLQSSELGALVKFYT